jgi:hypothetical protein
MLKLVWKKLAADFKKQKGGCITNSFKESNKLKQEKLFTMKVH